MEKQEIVQKVAEAIAEQLNIAPEAVRPESRLIEDLRADSLDVVTMVMDLEQEFDIEIPDEELANLKTIDDVVTFIENIQQ